MANQPTRQRLIDDWVDQLLPQFEGVYHRRLELPIPIFDIAEQIFGLRYDVEILRGRLAHASGFIVADKRLIVLNQDQNQRRMAFTMAHELAHWLFDSKQGSGLSKDADILKYLWSTQQWQRENTADYFAAAILMPRYMLRDILADTSCLTLSDISDLALLFNVSLDSMRRRLDQLRDSVDGINVNVVDDTPNPPMGPKPVRKFSARKGVGDPAASNVVVAGDIKVLDHHVLRKLTELKETFHQLFVLCTPESFERMFGLVEMKCVDGIVVARESSLGNLDTVKNVFDGDVAVVKFDKDPWADWVQAVSADVEGKERGELVGLRSASTPMLVLTRNDQNEHSYSQSYLTDFSRVIQPVKKLNNRKTAVSYIKQQKALGRRVVLATGCFDIITNAHVRFLKRAKAEGDILVVGIENDNRIRAMKGPFRPVNTAAQRLEIIEEFTSFVDLAFLIQGSPNSPLKEFYTRLYTVLKPDILAISEGDPYMTDRRDEIEAAGGQLVVVSRYEEGSTTSMLRNIMAQLPDVNEYVRVSKRQLFQQPGRGEQENWQQLGLQH